MSTKKTNPNEVKITKKKLTKADLEKQIKEMSRQMRNQYDLIINKGKIIEIERAEKAELNRQLHRAMEARDLMRTSQDIARQSSNAMLESHGRSINVGIYQNWILLVGFTAIIAILAKALL